MKKLTSLILLTLLVLSFISSFAFIQSVEAVTPTRVQGPTRAHGTSTSSLGASLSSTPQYGDLLVLAALSLQTGVNSITSITQTGVAWSRAINQSTPVIPASGNYLTMEIWFGNVWSSSAGKTITANTTASCNAFTVNVNEYSGVFALDKTSYSLGSYNQDNKTALPTGTTATTTRANEVFIGAVGTGIGGTNQNSPGNSFTELDGVVSDQLMLGFLEYIASSTAAASSSESGFSGLSSYYNYLGSIATFGDNGLFNLGLTAGQILNFTDTDHAIQVSLVVQSGSLNGLAYLSTSSTGTLQINSTGTGTYRISNNNTGSIYVNGVYYNQESTIYATNGSVTTITWNDNPQPSPTIIVNPTFSYYLRSDSYTTLGVSGYGLDTDYTNTAYLFNTTQSGAVTLKYGYRIYLYSSATSQTELTSGSPQAVITLSANTTGNAAATWLCPAMALTLGYQAFKIDLYQSDDGGSNWVSVASFVSPILIAESLQSSTWTLSLNINYYQTGGNTYCTVAWGSSTYRSGISGITFTAAKESAINFWRLSNGDLIGFTFGSYIDLIGEGAFYILCLFAVFASLYRRYGHVGIIVVAFLLFAGPGSLLVLVLGSYAVWAAAAAIILLIVAGTFVIWRIIR